MCRKLCIQISKAIPLRSFIFFTTLRKRASARPFPFQKSVTEKRAENVSRFAYFTISIFRHSVSLTSSVYFPVALSWDTGGDWFKQSRVHLSGIRWSEKNSMSEDLYVEPDPNKIVRFQAGDTEYMNFGDHINSEMVYENWSTARKSEDNTAYDQQKSIYLSCDTPLCLLLFLCCLGHLVFSCCELQ